MDTLETSFLEERMSQSKVKSSLAGPGHDRVWLNKSSAVETENLDLPAEAGQWKRSPSAQATKDMRRKHTLDVLLILLSLPGLIPLALFIALDSMCFRRAGFVQTRTHRLPGRALQVFQISDHVRSRRHDGSPGTYESGDEFKYRHDKNGLTA